ncbi:hypothetical protein [Nocardioides panaciterrulae]|uniref:Putative ferric reductase n=1 Tax=Nocardioides panaciterrulae TaxID=661492 RepID=A0A7Y9E7N4_9ACTN|nr:hypothetical protein [Nocardioides panaciterrulae]NYD42660.1 putative ferric reductase [Nocardioides panaciterrulae]
MPAVLSGPHGRFVHGKGTDRQVWIAGGVGVTPFLSWLRSLDEQPPPDRVDFFYSVSQESDGEVPYLAEMRAILERHPEVDLHVVRSAVDGRLTARRVLERSGADPRHLSIFMCGPEPMVRDLQQGFRADGVSALRIHREHFDWR